MHFLDLKITYGSITKLIEHQVKKTSNKKMKWDLDNKENEMGKATQQGERSVFVDKIFLFFKPPFLFLAFKNWVLHSLIKQSLAKYSKNFMFLMVLPLQSERKNHSPQN